MAYGTKNPNLESTILNDKGVAVVPNPATGKVRIIQRDGILLSQDDAGVETILGAGAGGGINYFTNPSFETGITEGVTLGGASAPTASAETAAPLFGTQSLKLVSTGGNSTSDFEIAGIDNAVIDGGILMQVTAYLETALVADDVWTAGIYNTTDAAYATTQTGLKGSGGAAKILNVHQAAFVPITGKTYVLRIEYTSAVSNEEIVVDGLKVTPEGNNAIQAFEQRTVFVDDTILDIVATSSGEPGPPTSITFVEAFAYADANGDYRFNVNARWVAASTAASRIKFAGVTFDTGAEVPVTVNTPTGVPGSGNIEPPNNRIAVSGGSAGTTWGCSADLPLASKPTWFDANLDNNKINLITQDLVTANSRIALSRTGIAGSQSGSGAARIEFDEIEHNVGGGFSTANNGEITCLFDGFVHVTGRVQYHGGTFAAAASLLVYKGGTFIHRGESGLASDNRSVNTTFEVSNGDVLTLRTQNTPDWTINDGNENVRFQVDRLQDYGSLTPVGFGLATPTQAGLIPAFEEGSYSPVASSLNNVGSPSFNDPYYSRVGNMVTVIGRTVVDPTTGATKDFNMSLPIARATNFPGSNFAGGTGGDPVDNNDLTWTVQSVGGTTDQVKFSLKTAVSDPINHAFFYQFSYYLGQ